MITGGDNGSAVRLVGQGAGSGLDIAGGTTGHGLYATGGSTSGHGIYSVAYTGTAGSGAVFAGQTTGHGILATAGATGYDINGDIHGTVDTVTTLTNAPTGMALEATLTAMEGATFDTGTDSLEAIRNRGDAAWVTGSGTGTLTAQQIWEYTPRTLSAFGFTVEVTGDWATDADITALSSHGDSAWATATGFSTHSAADVKTAIEAAGSYLEAIKNLLEADIAIDTTTTPWAIVFLKKDTGAIGVGTELLRQALKDTAGANITNTTTVIGQVGL